MNKNNDESKKSSKNTIFLFMFAIVVIGLFSVASSGIFNMPNLYTTLAIDKALENINGLDYVEPTDIQDLYNNAMYFDGTNYVNFGNILGIESTGFSGSIKTVFQGEQGTILSKGGQIGGYFLFLDTNGKLILLLKQTVSSGQYRRYDSTTTVDEDILLNISFNIGTLGSSFSASVNGASLSFTDSGVTGTYADTGEDFSIGSRAEGGSVLYTGVIADINITSVLTTLGNGNTDAKWVDISGNGNNGTVSGSPALFMGQGID